MDSIEIIYDHYKETFSLSKEAQARRNKNFVILCVLEALSFLILIKPEKAFEIIADGINSELDLTLSLGNSIIQTLIWILIAYVSIRYVQDMMYIERQYGYMDKLEKKISASIDYHNLFSREGDHYKESYPMVLNFIDLFYKMLMPILFIIINSVHIHREYMLEKMMTWALACDTILYVAIFIIMWFYFFEIHSKITGFCKKHIPLINKISIILRKWLKEV